MTDLDRLDADRFDPSGMLATVERSGAMWRAALERARATPAPARGPRPAGVVVAGMGGSGIAGDVAALAADRAGTLPVATVKGYELPAWVGRDHLVVAVSHSGDTEETLALVSQADQRGCRIAAISSGGRLGALAADRGWRSVEVPGGQPPRASLPHLVVALVAVLGAEGGLGGEALAGLDGVPEHVDGCVARWGRARPTSDNPAKQAAVHLHGRVPVLYGARGVGSVLALRGKCQINENAGLPAFWGEVPERDHNELVAWGAAGDRFAVVEIRSPRDEHERVRRRFAAAIDEFTAPLFRLDIDGPTWMQRLAGGIVLVDLVSVFLALLAGVDPTPVEAIERVKRRISEATSA